MVAHRRLRLAQRPCRYAGDGAEKPNAAAWLGLHKLIAVNGSRRDKLCIFCKKGYSSRKGEHVIPSWLIELLFPDDPQGYSISVNGEEQTKRDGTVRRSEAVSRFQVPACEGCNQILANRFEIGPTRDAVATLFGVGDGSRVVPAAQSRDVGEWLVKTVLLLAHEETENSDPGWVDFPYDWTAVPDTMWTWMTDGSAPPDGLSLWIARTSRSDEGVDRTRIGQRFFLPTINIEGSDTIQFLDNSPGIADVSINLVYHPEWEIVHPFELDNRCARVWPTQSGTIDFIGLPKLSGDEMDDFQRLFQPGIRLMVVRDFFAIDREPLRIGWEGDAISIPGVRGVARFSPDSLGSS